MAQLNTVENILQRKGMPRLKRANLKIDMTPMVDLGFLLICFFVITATMSEPKATNLFMPKEGPPIPIADSKTLTVLPGKDNHIFYYHGNWETAVKNNAVYITNYSVNAGLGKIIREKQKRLDQQKADKKDLMLIIKAEKEASYKNIIDILDEVLINGVTHYVVVEPTIEELNYTGTHGSN
jgi:biopolymer transport protein ExbD